MSSFQKTYSKIETSSNGNTSNKKTPWRTNNDRHYCPICNVWMASDLQSIRLHENGKKHKENVELDLLKRRDEKKRKEKEEQMMQSSLAMMERVAQQKLEGDIKDSVFVGTTTAGAAGTVTSFGAGATPFSSLPPPTSSQQKSKKEISSSWQERKRHREDEKKKKDEKDAENNIDNEEDDDQKKKKRRKIKLPGPNEGHYIIDKVTYLEGATYATILEQDMPIQLWIGPNDTPTERRRSSEMTSLWKMGLIVKVRSNENGTTDEDEKEEAAKEITCDVAYLRSPKDEDETLEKSVTPTRIRIVLGSDPDTIPNTLEEARLMLLGGEEEITVENNSSSQPQNSTPSIDENTGLSSWGTVSIRRVTVQKEIKEERSRQRQKQREEKRREEEKERELNERRMEEVKHAHGDDSALGAYDVWSASGKIGYKGVDIHGGIESKVGGGGKAGDSGGSGGGKEVVSAGALSRGKGLVAFKKVKKAGDSAGGGNDSSGKKNSLFQKKAAKKKKHRRTTFADDDD